MQQRLKQMYKINDKWYIYDIVSSYIYKHIDIIPVYVLHYNYINLYQIVSFSKAYNLQYYCACFLNNIQI